jgi:hypothetical protein
MRERKMRGAPCAREGNEGRHIVHARTTRGATPCVPHCVCEDDEGGYTVHVRTEGHYIVCATMMEGPVMTTEGLHNDDRRSVYDDLVLPFCSTVYMIVARYAIFLQTTQLQS